MDHGLPTLDCSVQSLDHYGMTIYMQPFKIVLSALTTPYEAGDLDCFNTESIFGAQAIGLMQGAIPFERTRKLPLAQCSVLDL